MSFKNKIAIVTGAASGIGLLTAQNLGRLGAKVVLTGVDAEQAQQAADQIRNDGDEAIGIEVDVRK